MGMNAKHFSAKGDERGTVELPDEVFGQPVHEHAIWEAVRCYLANQRQGTASVKTRAEVSGWCIPMAVGVIALVLALTDVGISRRNARRTHGLSVPGPSDWKGDHDEPPHRQ